MPDMATIPFLQVDSFTHEPFGGNPAAVCLLESEPPPDWMQHVAAEMNLSETAFAWPSSDGFGLRWFTPVAEVDLCGHATLATAHALWETKRLAKGEPARFDTRSGRLTASQASDAIRMDFPAEPAEACDPGDLANALGWRSSGVAKTGWTFSFNSRRRIGSQLHAGSPALGQAGGAGRYRHCRLRRRRSRFCLPLFLPGAGHRRGSGDRLGALLPRAVLGGATWENLAHRSSDLTPCGVVDCELAGDRVLLGGHAVTVLAGEVLATPTGA